MKEYTLILVRYNPTGDYLFCYRMKDPWKGLYNFVGGKLENGETPKDCAIRELKEETNIIVEPDNIYLISKIDYYFASEGLYDSDGTTIWIYATDIDDRNNIIPEKNPLSWFNINTKFYGNHRNEFAGDGNIEVFIKYYERIREKGKLIHT